MKLAKLDSGTIVNLDMISSIEKIEQKDGRFTYCCHIGDMHLSFEEEEYANFSNYMDLDKVLTLKSLMINKKIEDIYKENRKMGNMKTDNEILGEMLTQRYEMVDCKRYLGHYNILNKLGNCPEADSLRIVIKDLKRLENAVQEQTDESKRKITNKNMKTFKEKTKTEIIIDNSSIWEEGCETTFAESIIKCMGKFPQRLYVEEGKEDGMLVLKIYKIEEEK